MEWHQIVGALINAGGFGIMAAAIFWLHVQSIHQFRDEMRCEREAFAARNAVLVQAIERQTAELSGRLERMADRMMRGSSSR